MNSAQRSLRPCPASLPPPSLFVPRPSNYVPASPLFATLTSHSQLLENTTTLSPAVATLTSRVKHKSFACHSCRKHPGWGSPVRKSRLLLTRAPAAHAQQHPLPSCFHGATSRFSGYPGGGVPNGAQGDPVSSLPTDRAPFALYFVTSLARPPAKIRPTNSPGAIYV